MEDETRGPKPPPKGPPSDSGASGADRLRQRIDRGEAGDKVDFPDPAAAPLGTDAEAGGHPPTRAQVRMAERQELHPRRRADAGPRDAESGVPKHKPSLKAQPYWWLFVLFVLLIAAIWLL